ncbi:MAG: hypothetical protein HQ509_03015 [Candidatus Marinimicrobia bacterium]|nr:hypothetical protein [Candidatus Neomarinimicrobiota bacterium]
MKDDFFIRILKYAVDKGAGGFSVDRIMQDLDLTIIEADYVESNSSEIYGNGYFIEAGIHNENNRKMYRVSMDGRMKLLEYEELHFARKAATAATVLSIIAIIIAGLTFYLTLVKEPVQINYPPPHPHIERVI